MATLKMHFWLFWLNEVGFMETSFNYGKIMLLSYIWTYTNDSSYQLSVWKLRKLTFFKIWGFRGCKWWKTHQIKKGLEQST